ncbi:MAG: FecCD family ABC transporter permease [Fervidicoccaceae archaeon]|jgi:iron complex transport system permease protein
MKEGEKIGLTAVLCFFVFMISLGMGSYGFDPIGSFKILSESILGKASASNPLTNVVIQIRLPRIIAAILIGASLSVSGAGFQSLFRNPLVSPDILGVLAGAGFGASIGILLDFPLSLVQAIAFALGLAALAASYAIAWRGGGARIIDLVLSGIIIGSLFKSLMSLVKFLADPESKLPQITYWLMGGLASVTWKDVEMLAIISIPSLFLLYILRWSLDAFAVGEEEAKTLGIKVEAYKAAVIVLSTLPAAASTVVAGIIGWIGLVIPHISRMLFGESNRYTIPGSAVVGAIFLLFVDTISRAVLPTELPLEVLTSFVGVPFFAYLLRRRIYHGWS